jgi:shikimate dehydrogenase
VPYKEKVIPFLDETTRDSGECGSVNTIVNREGRLIGDSTDGRGFLKSCQWHGIELKGARMLLLGAGGAGRAVGYSAASGGTVELVLVDPAVEKAAALRDDLKRGYPHLEVQVLAPEEMTADMARDRHLVVNASPVGAGDDRRLPVPPEFLNKDQIVYDLVYSPVKTGLMTAAEAAGAKTYNGLAMLLFQGAASFLIWTGESPPLQVMSDALCRGAGVDPWNFEGSGL